jgi:hypothetical protein
VVDDPETGAFTVPDAGGDEEGAAGTDFASVFILATAVARNLSSIAMKKHTMPPPEYVFRDVGKIGPRALCSQCYEYPIPRARNGIDEFFRAGA